MRDLIYYWTDSDGQKNMSETVYQDNNIIVTHDVFGDTDYGDDSLP